VFGLFKKTELPNEREALPGRNVALRVAEKHAVLGNPMAGPFPGEMQIALFGMGHGVFLGCRTFVLAAAWGFYDGCWLCGWLHAQSDDPTQGMQQGPDRGTQYRSGIYTHGEAQHAQAELSKLHFQSALDEKGFGQITTEIIAAPTFYYAEDEHQQYLHKNPHGYCSLRGIGVACSVPKDQLAS